MTARRPMIALCLACLTAAGCASSEPPPHVDADGYQPAAASALAFDPPIVLAMVDQRRLDAVLAREGRGEAAFLGYDTPTVQTYYMSTIDRQGTYAGGGYGFGYGYGVGLYGGYGFVGGGAGFYDDHDRRVVVTESFQRVR